MVHHDFVTMARWQLTIPHLLIWSGDGDKDDFLMAHADSLLVKRKPPPLRLRGGAKVEKREILPHSLMNQKGISSSSPLVFPYSIAGFAFVLTTRNAPGHPSLRRSRNQS